MKITAAVIFLILLFIQQAYAELDVSNSFNFTSITWDTKNNLQLSKNFCVKSTNDSNEITDYSVQLNNHFFLKHRGSPATLAVRIYYTNKITQQISEFTPNSLSKVNNTGSKNCSSDTAQLTLKISTQDLFSTPSGIYDFSSAIEFSHENNNNNLRKNISASITIPSIVSITQLDDINLGRWTGQQQLYKKNDICIYDNTGGDYSVLIQGKTSQTEFLLSQNQGTQHYYLPYTVEFNNKPHIPGKNEIYNSPNTTAPDCMQQVNASLAITITQTHLSAVPAGLYTDTLTITIAPD